MTTDISDCSHKELLRIVRFGPLVAEKWQSWRILYRRAALRELRLRCPTKIGIIKEADVLESVRSDSVLTQIHHQFKNHTDMVSQRVIADNDELREFQQELMVSHPLPDGALWMACNEGSEHFIMAAQ